MPLWVKIMYHHLDKIKAPTIIVIHMAKIMMIHSYMRHLRKKLHVSTLLVIQYPSQTHHNRTHYLSLEKNIYVSKWRVKVPMNHNVLNKEH